MENVSANMHITCSTFNIQQSNCLMEVKLHRRHPPELRLDGDVVLCGTPHVNSLHHARWLPLPFTTFLGSKPQNRLRCAQSVRAYSVPVETLPGKNREGRRRRPACPTPRREPVQEPLRDQVNSPPGVSPSGARKDECEVEA